MTDRWIFAFGASTIFVFLLTIFGMWSIGDTLTFIAVSFGLTATSIMWWTVSCMVVYYMVVLYSNFSKPVVAEMDVLGDDLEPMHTEAEDGIEHPVTGDSELDGMVAFIPYMLMAYLVVLVQAF